MNVILDKFGNVISRSENLRGIRDYISRSHSDYAIKIDASHVGNEGEGLLSILFNSGNSYQVRFASFEVLTRYALKNWRNLYGVMVSVDGVNKGGLTYKTFE